MMKTLIVVAAVAFAFQTAGAQGERPRRGGADAPISTTANGQDAQVTSRGPDTKAGTNRVLFRVYGEF